MHTRELIHTALMVALCVALGYLMAGVPNVELISAAIFACGALSGVRRGALVGLLAELIYAGMNPYGISPPPLFLAQLCGMAAIGAAGGTLRRVDASRAWAAQVLFAGSSGFLLTLFYDLLTNSAIYVTVRESSSWAAVVLAGLSFPFPLAHPLGNSVGFALLVPAVRRAVPHRSVA
ncbi:MAG: hypothetical protein ACE5G2_12640 [Candidatus Krumholzibacteriia bacterium]